MSRHQRPRGEPAARDCAEARIMAGHGIRDFYVAAQGRGTLWRLRRPLPNIESKKHSPATSGSLAPAHRCSRSAAPHSGHGVARRVRAAARGPVLAGTATAHVDVQLPVRGTRGVRGAEADGPRHPARDRRAAREVNEASSAVRRSGSNGGRGDRGHRVSRDGIRQSPVSPVLAARCARESRWVRLVAGNGQATGNRPDGRVVVP